MNLSILRTLTLSLSAAIAPVSLMAQGSIHANIPFDFNVGTKSFAAGEYRVQHVTPTVLAILNAAGSTVAMVQANSAFPTAAPGTAQLTFNRYGDRYFLSQVSEDSRGWQLSKSAVEKELIAKRTPAGLIRLASAGGK
jgi:hypothetical protein